MGRRLAASGSVSTRCAAGIGRDASAPSEDPANRRLVPVSEVERLRGGGSEHELSARNRLAGTVRDVRIEGLLAQVEIEAGPFRIVSVITSEAAEQLGLEPGVPATALVKATLWVLIER